MLLPHPLFARSRAQAQSEERAPPGGLQLESDADYQAVEPVKMIRAFKDPDGAGGRKLPRAVDLSTHFPEAGDQGGQQSCVGWSLAYAIKSFQEYRELGWSLQSPFHRFSPSYLYNQINGGRDGGAPLDKGVAMMQEKGAIPLALMPYKLSDYTSQPSAQEIELGKSFRVNGYRRLSEKNVDELKRVLASQEPIFFAMTTYSTLFHSQLKANNDLYDRAGGSMFNVHAVVLVGYDDERRAFKFLNSWGKSWGTNGYAWVSYDFVPQVAKRAYVLYDAPTPRDVVAYLDQLAPSVPELEQKPVHTPKPKPEPEKPKPAPAPKPPVPKKAPAPSLPPKPKPALKPEPVPSEKPAPAPKPVPPTEPVPEPMPPAPPKPEPATPPPVLLPRTLPLPRPVDVPVYLVPEERGMQLGTAWIRLGDDWGATKQIVSQATKATGGSVAEQGGFMLMITYNRDNAVGVIMILNDPGTRKVSQIAMSSGITGRTNRGLALGGLPADTARIYGSPDKTEKGNDYYFYEAVQEDQGGLGVEKHVTLHVSYDDYDPNHKIDSLRLFTANQAVMMGTQAKAEVGHSEIEETAQGTAVSNPSGRPGPIAFTAPKRFGSPRKNADASGYAYSFKGDLNVAVLDLSKAVAEKGPEKALSDYIQYRLKSLPSILTVDAPSKHTWGGLAWAAYGINPKSGLSISMPPIFYAFALKGKAVYVVHIVLPDRAWLESEEGKRFFDSIRVENAAASLLDTVKGWF